MGTVSKFGADKRLLDPSNATLDGQARVNAEIFTAVEILGRKLERVEAERDQLARRLALIESSATVDEKTGKLYLPALVAPSAPPASAATPRWIGATALMSSAVALFALGFVVFHEPTPALTKEQIAVLESLRGTQFTQLAAESKGWKSLESEMAENAQASSTSATQDIASTAPASPGPQATSITEPVATAHQLPSPSELEKLEETAEPLKMAAVETPDNSSAPLPLVASEKTAPTGTQAVPASEEAMTAKTPEKVAKKPEVPVQPADKAVSETAATAISATKAAGGMTPDAALPKKLATLQKRAYQGIPEAQHDLATIYAAGTLVPQDYQRAAFWFAKAADGGIANANYNMGVVYHQGLGVTVNMAKALDWYERAAELGHPEAMYNLGIAYIEGVGTKTDITKGVSYFKRAAKAGVTQAAYNLGVLYESNFIGPIDTQKAAEWYKTAAKAGHEGARDALARLQGSSNVAATDMSEQALSLADKVEPAAGGDEEYGEGDASPVSERSSNSPKTILADIQRILIKQGLLPGRADGSMNQKTEDAIRASQKRFGMSEDGQPSQELLEKLLQAPPAETLP